MTNEVRETLFKGTTALIAGAFAATATGLFSNPQIWGLFSGLAVNVASQFSVEACMPYIKEKWLSHPQRTVNNHIQRALHTSILNALAEIESEYLEFGHISPEEEHSLQNFYYVLRSRSEIEFLDATRDELESEEIYRYLNQPTETLVQLTDRLRISLDPQSNAFYFTDRFINFFPIRFAEKVQFQFREELKKGGEAKQALDLLFFDTLHAGLVSLQADNKEIRNLLDKALSDIIQGYRHIDFFGEIWISAIQKNCDHFNLIEQNTAKILEEIRDFRVENSELRKLIEKLLRQNITLGILNSNRFSDLKRQLADTQTEFEAAERKATQARTNISDLEAAISQAPNLAPNLTQPLQSAKNDLFYWESVALSIDRKRDKVKNELNEFLEAVLSTQKQIMNSNSERADKARHLFESGDFSEANKVLDADALQRDKNFILQQDAMVRQERKTLSEDFILKANLSVLNKELSWFDIAYQHYQDAISIYESYTTHFEFAHFLAQYNKQNESIFHYEKALGFPGDFIQMLSATNNLGDLYRLTGRFRDAEASYKNTLQGYEKLSEYIPIVFQRDLATANNNLGVLYRQINRFEESEVLFLEAQRLRRSLSKDPLLIYQLDLSNTLRNLGVLYDIMRRFDEAKTCHSEAVEICRKLSEQDPKTYQVHLAASLNDMGILFRDTKAVADAEAYYKEALQINRELAKDAPQQHLPEVATTLNNLGLLLYDAKHFDDAKIYIAEATNVYRQLTSDNASQTYQPELATALNTQGMVLRALDRFDESFSAFSEALHLRKELANNAPDVYGPFIATTLNNLAALQIDMNQTKDAIEHFEESLRIFRKLSPSSERAYRDRIIVTLNNLGFSYRKNGQHAEAQNCFKEAKQLADGGRSN